MITKLIELSIKNRFIVILLTLFFIVGAYFALIKTPLDALPDLSPPQVIVKLKWQGQSTDIIESQGTYPLVSQLLGVSNIETVRAYSSYENGLIYIIFKEGTDLYWARSRVLEQLSSIQSQLPSDLAVTLGPDASGVSWAYQYALKSDTKNLVELRTLQDYYYKFALMSVDGVSEVASVGGFTPNYQVTINNDDLIRYRLSLQDIAKVLKNNNNDTGGRIKIENGFEWIIEAKGYVKNLDDIRKLVVTKQNGIPISIKDIAKVELVPSARRGVADLNGEGEVVGGIVLLQYGEDVYSAIKRVKQKLDSLKVEGVDVVEVYDRSSLIEKAVETLKETLIEESLIVVLVIALFLMHLRSSLIILITLPLTIGITFLFMYLFNVSSNIMSLGGIAIALGTMVDASIVMIENAHKSLYRFQQQEKRVAKNSERVEIILRSSKQVGVPIFFALALIVVSFLPIFALNGQEGRLFTPLAYTKTFTMVVGALLSITLVPVLMIFFIRGEIPAESKNPLNRFFIWIYYPIIKYSLKFKYMLILLTIASLVSIYPLYKGLKWEFMPMLNEQTLMYMPVTPYGISIDLSKELTQKTDAIIKSFPEVQSVFGKGGRADSATDPAPLSMLETIITLKPQSEWREGMTFNKLRQELDQALQIPGLTNSWTYPIRGRIDMLLSGIRTPLGIKIYGTSAKKLEEYAENIEAKLRNLKGTDSVLADKASAGYYLNIDIDEEKLQRYGLNKKQLLEYVSLAIGGIKVSTLYKGLERYTLSLRLEESDRDSLESIKNIKIKTKLGFIPLHYFADISYKEAPSNLKSEMAKPVTFIYITPKADVSAQEYKKEAQKLLQEIEYETGYYMDWAGESEYLESALAKIIWIMPLVLLSILMLIYLALKDVVATLIIFFTLPFALLGGLVYLNSLHFSMSVAVIVGFLALLGVAAETAIVMTIYLQESVDEVYKKRGKLFNLEDLNSAIYEGAVQRVRPKLMTVFSILAALIPIMYSSGVGSEVMQRIAAPMIGGVVSSALLSLLIIPILFEIYQKNKFTRIIDEKDIQS